MPTNRIDALVSSLVTASVESIGKAETTFILCALYCSIAHTDTRTEVASVSFTLEGNQQHYLPLIGHGLT